MNNIKQGIKIINKCITCTQFQKCYSDITLCKVTEGNFEHYKEDPIMIQMKQDWNNGHWDDSGDL